jgi:hypothetical protein
MTTNTTLSTAKSGRLEGRGFRVPTALSGICARCIPVASSGPSVNDHVIVSVPFVYPEARRALPHPRKPSSTELRTVQWHRHSCLCAFAEPGTRPTADDVASLACISSELTPLALPHPRKPSSSCTPPLPFACPEPRRALTHPRKPSPFYGIPMNGGTLSCPLPFALPHSRNLFTPCASTGSTPLAPTHLRKPSRFFPFWHGRAAAKILIANPRLEFRLTARKLSQLRISNRKKIAIFHPVFRRSAKTVLPPSFPSGRGFIPSINRRRIVTVPLALNYPRKPFPRFASTEFTPFAPPHPRKPATRHPSLITGSLIYGGAIRNPCKHRKFSDIQISNRR